MTTDVYFDRKLPATGSLLPSRILDPPGSARRRLRITRRRITTFAVSYSGV